MKMGNWKYLQPVGISDRFVRKIPGWSKENCRYTNMDCLWRLCYDDIFEIRIGRYSIWSCTVPQM